MSSAYGGLSSWASTCKLPLGDLPWYLLLLHLHNGWCWNSERGNLGARGEENNQRKTFDLGRCCSCNELSRWSSTRKLSLGDLHRHPLLLHLHDPWCRNSDRVAVGSWGEKNTQRKTFDLVRCCCCNKLVKPLSDLTWYLVLWYLDDG